MITNDKTQRSAAPCKAGRLRRLHGVGIVAGSICWALLPDDHLKEEACMKYINAKRPSFPMRWSRNCKAIFKGAIFMFPLIRRGENNGERLLATGRNCSSGTAKSQKSFGMELLWRRWQKSISCLYMPFGKSFIRNKPAGAAEMPAPVMIYRSIRYCPVDRKEAA